jgi:hypothetical protein
VGTLDLGSLFLEFLETSKKWASFKLWQALSGRSFSSAVGGPPKPDHSRLVPKILITMMSTSTYSKNLKKILFSEACLILPSTRQLLSFVPITLIIGTKALLFFYAMRTALERPRSSTSKSFPLFNIGGRYPSSF